ncbi:hypothetical protein ACN27F_10390 [Solwaraspora sp. WMMB335]|uniref:hypothetical protein n=1 Tax=Solwaraspora sp. WMMB335 TaxID=3404118 RepID=UPI003B92A0C5
MATRIELRGAWVCVLGIALGVLAGCTQAEPGAGPADSASPSATASPTPPSEEDQARREILDTYNGYLEAYIRASATADYRTEELATYVGEPLLGQLLNNLFNMSRSGVRNEGRPVWSPTVTEVRLAADEAVIQDCFDSTNWNAVGGKAQPTAQAKRYPVVAKVRRVDDNWYVYESTADRGSTC